MRRPKLAALLVALVALLPPCAASAQLRWVGELSEDSLARPGFLSRIAGVFAGGATRDRLELPFDVSVSPSELLVLVRGTNDLLVIDRKSRKVREVDGVSERLTSPVTVVGKPDDFYVSDPEQCVVYHGRQGKLTVFADMAAGLVRPTGLALDTVRGRLWVIDTGRHEVVCFTTDGRMVMRMGRRGEDDTCFNFPTFVAVGPDGSIVVNDTMNGKVKKFTPLGALVWAVGGFEPETAVFERAKGLAVDSQGRVFVVDNLSDQIIVLSPDGAEIARLGSTGNGPDEFWAPVGIAVCNDTVVVADTQNDRLALLVVEPGGGE